MGRRIAIAILLTVWAMLIVGGVGAYVAIRAVLLEDLDAQLVHAARQVPEVEARAGEASGRAARYVILDDAGRRVSSTTLNPPEVIRNWETLSAGFIRLADGGGGRYRSLAIRFDLGGDGRFTMIYSEPADRFDRALGRLVAALVGVGLLAGAAAAGVAVLAARAALRPLRETVDVIGAIDEANLDRRIDAVRLPEELRPAAARLNEMLARLESAFARRKQFLADASHELRTPVASLVTTMEVALRRPRGADELTATLTSCLGDARLLRKMVQALLEHARGEATPPAAERIDLTALLDECAALVEPLAAERGLIVRRLYAGDGGHGEAAAAELIADRRRIASVVTNLLANAVEYNRPGGRIDVSTAWPSDNEVEVAVRDTGIGIAAEHLPHVFEPFFRAGKGGADDATAADHLGLGLFLVKSHVAAAGGTVAADSVPGQGTTFRVRLPAVRKLGAERSDHLRSPAPPAAAAAGGVRAS